uniref:Uncharacterized protein n=1 Tax=Setaria viridis TaxID=4556 RepID=A0A4U6W4J4_SETVI|nr:hypothetical protein SEVIR_1G047401v2 [Setaria viridis]
MAGGGVLLDWWSSTAAAALGPDWLSSILAASSPSASASAGSQSTEAREAKMPVRGASARRRGGRGGQAPRVVHIFMDPPEGLDSPKYGAPHQDASNMETMAQDGVVYMERHELVEIRKLFVVIRGELL